MIANYHTHTWRCNHARGEEEDYVLCALERGLDILGFSDHAPYIFPGTHYSHFRMRPEELEDYCDTVLSLRKKYEGKITMPLGLEMEFYPAFMREQMAFLRDSPVEYLLLGQHFVGNEIGEHYSGAPTADRQVLEKYCRQCADAMQTGLFSYFAHPDLIFFHGSEAFYRENMRMLCREARSCGIPLEINLLGIREGRNYPNPMFWQLAAEEGCACILGCDAHSEHHLLETDSEKAARELAELFDLPILDRAKLLPIR